MLNEVFTSLAARRRYEVWFVRLGLADAGEAWWFRYLLMNPGRNGCPENAPGMPVQMWATRFPQGGRAESFIQGFPLDGLELSARGARPFHLRSGDNGIDEDSCRGALHVAGHVVSWDLHYQSTFRTTLSYKGWIGFSRTPHSDALFSGRITLDGHSIEGNPLGFGVQGHNCGYRHRGFWIWTHAFFLRREGRPSTFEALFYDMPFGLVFRKAVLWHEGEQHVFRSFREIGRDRENFEWAFRCVARDGLEAEVRVDGRGPGIHRLPYLKTDCSGSFEVVNNSLSRASIVLKRSGSPVARLETADGAVLEMGGRE